MQQGICYELVTAKTFEEALENSSFFPGQKASVVEISASANSDGTWSVTPKFQIEEKKPSA